MAYSRIFFIKVNFLVAEARRETHLCIFFARRNMCLCLQSA